MAAGKPAELLSENKSLSNQKSVNDAVKSICDIMRRGNVTSAVQYVRELTWIPFLRVLNEIEQATQAEMEALGHSYRPPLAKLSTAGVTGPIPTGRRARSWSRAPPAAKAPSDSSASASAWST